MGMASERFFRNLREKKRALVVEDEMVMQDLFVEVLSERGFEVDSCSVGKDALELYESNIYSLIILDWNLPDANGPDLCREMRKKPHADLIFILMATGKNSSEAHQDALDSGADDYLTKPFRLNQLQLRLAVAETQIRHRLERARAESERDRERHFLQILMDAIPAPVYYKSPTGAYLGCNQAFAVLQGKAPEEIIGKTVYDLFGREVAAEQNAMDQALMEGEATTQVYESTQRDLDSNLLHIIVNKARFYQPDGSLGGIIGVLQDITERKKAEQALVRAQQLAAVGTLSAGVAHEFNNINTIVMGHLQLAIESGDLPTNYETMLRKSLKSSQRATEITRKLLSFSSPGELQKRMTNLRDIVRDTISIIEGEYKSEGIDLQCKLDSTPDLLIDGAQIGQVLMNLLINARHATLGMENKKITIETGVRGVRSFLRVVDTGCGIPEEDQPNLFLPFFSTKGEYGGGNEFQAHVKGNGLGLSISDTIVRDHNGEIAVESAVGEGSSFTVWLPIQETTECGRDLIEDVPEKHGICTGKIYVLDDEPDIQILLNNVLGAEGHGITCGQDGQDALQSFVEQPYDLVLVDLQMPKMDGLEFLRKLQALPEEYRPLPMVVSGRLQPHSEVELKQLGVVATLSKPFNLRDLRQRIQTLLLTHGRGQALSPA